MPNRQDLRDVLAANPWFRGLPAPLADGILSLGLVRRLDGQTAYAAGDPPNGLFALISGEIRIVQTTREGRSALLMIASPGAWFGEAAMIDGLPRTSEAVAVGVAQVLQLTPAVFRRLTGDNAEHYAAFARLVCEQYRRAMDYIVLTANLPLAVRLAQRLVGLAHDHGRPGEGGVAIDIRLSQETLAKMVGASRQSVNGALGRMEKRGIVSMGYGALTVRDTAALEAVARSRMLPDFLR